MYTHFIIQHSTYQMHHANSLSYMGKLINKTRIIYIKHKIKLFLPLLKNCVFNSELCAVSLQFFGEIYKSFLSEYGLYSRLFLRVLLCSLWKFLITTGCSSKAGQTSSPAGQGFCKPAQSLMTTWIFRDRITWVASEGRFSSDIKQTRSTFTDNAEQEVQTDLKWINNELKLLSIRIIPGSVQLHQASLESHDLEMKLEKLTGFHHVLSISHAIGVFDKTKLHIDSIKQSI